MLSERHSADPQPDPECWYVTTITAEDLLSSCPNFDWVRDTLPDFAKRNGLDNVKYNATIEAALRAYSGYAYVELALVLRVTAIVRRVGADVTRALQLVGKRISVPSTPRMTGRGHEPTGTADRVAITPVENVAYWHVRDIPRCPFFGRCWG